MFKNRICPRCYKENRLISSFCSRCGTELGNVPVTSNYKHLWWLTACLLVIAASVLFRGDIYSKLLDREASSEANKANQTRQLENRATSSSGVTSERIANTPKPSSQPSSIATPKATMAPTPTPAPILTCDDLQSRIFKQEFIVGFNEAKAEMSRLTNEIFERNDPKTEEASLDRVVQDFTAKVNLLYLQYEKNVKSINCKPEALIELKK